MSRIRAWGLVGLVLGLTAAGCGPSGPKLVQLSGTVTFKGEPVPAGYITFTPPAGVGRVCTVQIKDGKYNTAEMQVDPGVNPGPNTVTIAGFNGKKEPLYGQGKQIFNPVTEQYTVPDAGGTKDFTVPDSAGKNVKIEPTSDD